MQRWGISIRQSVVTKRSIMVGRICVTWWGFRPGRKSDGFWRWWLLSQQKKIIAQVFAEFFFYNYWNKAASTPAAATSKQHCRMLTSRTILSTKSNVASAYILVYIHTYIQIYIAPKSWQRIRGAGTGWLDSESRLEEVWLWLTLERWVCL